MHPLDPRTTALLIVDLQNDFLTPGGAYDRGGAVSREARVLPARVAPVARAVKAHGGLVAASLFTLWPDAHGEPMISPHLKQLRPFLAKGDFAAGSRGQANVAELDGLVDVSVWKVAYSAFFNTQLDWVLRRAGVSSVVIAGIVTNGGVASTARDAHMRDYHVTVLADGCAAPTPAMHDAALADLRTVADITTCQGFMDRLAG
ncbi:cysteine hydrolase family protein [Achromobacter sp. PAB15]|uniref:cysteine hydrolase family protein n=1 Tax=Achromobacter sp. PAB15 TaxID=3233048 RepID=UPI003F93D26B